MTTSSLTFLALALCLGSAVSAAQRIPMSAAVAQCKHQNSWDQGDILDGATETSRAARVSQRFRACVFAKTGKYPAETKKNGLSISGSASIGIVTRN